MLLCLILLCVHMCVTAQVTWKRTYGGLAQEGAHSIRTLDDGGAVVCGSTGSFGTVGGDMYVLRIDINGQLLWSVVLGGSGVETGEDIVVLPDGGFLAIGSTNSFGEGGYDGFVVRLSPLGEELWQRTYGTSQWDLLYAGAFTEEGILLTGQTFGMGAGDGEAWLVRIFADGEEGWSRSYDSVGSGVSRSIRSLGMEGCILGGTTDLGGTEADALLVRVAADGEMIWMTELGGSGEEFGYDVEHLASGGFVITGYTQSFSAVRQMFLAKSNEAGEEVWVRNVSSDGDDWEAHSVKELENGNFVVAGYTEEYGAGDKDVSMLFLSPQGDFISGPTYGGVGADQAWSVALTADNGYYLAGSSDSYGSGMEAVFVIRSDGDTLNGSVVDMFDPVGLQERATAAALSIYPVPSMSGSSVALPSERDVRGMISLYDMRGALVVVAPYLGDRFQLPEVVAGIYELRLDRTTGTRSSCRMIIY